ncbi:hypothetical protein ACRALDRAFT_1065457 [Sodiomyces alcalophilus JCM 7366]|uniref:uncharacterized protein n=1 Tax=Sodiomyces alcalophilus JCM 7366 TaxID=591952 RepID=UPI0039B5EF1A
MRQEVFGLALIGEPWLLIKASRAPHMIHDISHAYPAWLGLTLKKCIYNGWDLREPHGHSLGDEPRSFGWTSSNIPVPSSLTIRSF